ncbi:MAG: YhcH/YjgK/YiaL family protein [Thermodesulfobacteriota bacterium]
MILDRIENFPQYLSLSKGFAKAAAFLARKDLAMLADGRYELDGDRVYAMVSRVAGRARDGAELEAHRRYIDIQLVLAGTETMGWKPASACTELSGEYDQETDFQLFADEPASWIATNPGCFVVFFPDDAHMPLLSRDHLHKVVIKVAVEQG